MKRTSSLSLMPTTPVAMFDVWKVGLMAFELWTTSLSTITMRQHLWQTQPFFSPKMMLENQRMVTEKIEASMEAGLVMQKALFSSSLSWRLDVALFTLLAIFFFAAVDGIFRATGTSRTCFRASLLPVVRFQFNIFLTCTGAAYRGLVR